MQKFTLNSLAIGLSVFLASTNAFAQNNNLNDEIFSEPVKSKETQLGLTIGDLIAAYMIKPSTRIELSNPRFASTKVALEVAETSLKNAQGLLTEAEKTAKLTALQNSINTVQNLIEKAPTSDLDELSSLTNRVDELTSDLRRVSNLDVVTDAQKAAQMDEALKAVAAARSNFIEAAAQVKKGPGFLGRTFKNVRYIGSFVFLVDAASRAYIWNVLEKNPTLSPVATWAWTKGEAAYEAYIASVAAGESKEQPKTEDKK